MSWSGDLELIPLAVAIGLLTLPAIGYSLGFAARPRRAAQHTAASLVGGLVLLEAGFIICAAPIVWRLADLEPWRAFGSEHLYPGAEVAGWISLVGLIALPVMWSRSTTTAWNARRSARIRHAIGTRQIVDGIEVVVLPSSEQAAFAIPGPNPQIVLSSALVDGLGPSELELVVRHEAVHLRSHDFYLWLISGLSPLAKFIPGLRRSLWVLGLWLERWSDEGSCQTDEERPALRSLLLRLSLGEPAHGFGFGAPDTIHARVLALGRNPITHDWGALGTLAIGVVLTLSASVTLFNWLG